MDKLTSLKKQKIKLRPKNPWYDKDLKTSKRQVRRRERWLKYKSEACWIAYKKCQNSYYGKLNLKKKMVLREKFTECKKDSKKIHSLVTNITCKQQPQQWPPHKSDEDLAVEFGTFLLEKIDKNCKALNNKL